MRIVETALRTDLGRRREINEDCVLRLDHVPLLAVADGMGGHAAGEVASSLAIARLGAWSARLVEAVAAARSDGPLDPVRETLERAFQDAHSAVQTEAKVRGTPGMGTTLIAAAVAGGRAIVAHVGDSRAYLFRGGTLHALTMDHSLAMLRYQRGELSWDEAETHPDRHRIYQAIGPAVDLDIAIGELELADDDILLLCSDGLSGLVVPGDISAMLAAGGGLEAAAETLVDAANAAGGTDNISVILARVEGERTVVDAAQTRAALRRSLLFQGALDSDLAAALTCLHVVTLEQGARLFSEGDPADDFFLVVAGALQVSKNGLPLDRVGPGGHLGELALVGGGLRSADVTAAAPTRLLRLSRDDFHSLSRRRPALGVRMSHALLGGLGARLRDLTSRLDGVMRAARGA